MSGHVTGARNENPGRLTKLWWSIQFFLSRRRKNWQAQVAFCHLSKHGVRTTHELQFSSLFGEKHEGLPVLNHSHMSV